MPPLPLPPSRSARWGAGFGFGPSDPMTSVTPALFSSPFSSSTVPLFPFPPLSFALHPALCQIRLKDCWICGGGTRWSTLCVHAAGNGGQPYGAATNHSRSGKCDVAHPWVVAGQQCSRGEGAAEPEVEEPKGDCHQESRLMELACMEDETKLHISWLLDQFPFHLSKKYCAKLGYILKFL